MPAPALQPVVGEDQRCLVADRSASGPAVICPRRRASASSARRPPDQAVLGLGDGQRPGEGAAGPRSGAPRGRRPGPPPRPRSTRSAPARAAVAVGLLGGPPAPQRRPASRPGRPARASAAPAAAAGRRRTSAWSPTAASRCRPSTSWRSARARASAATSDGYAASDVERACPPAGPPASRAGRGRARARGRARSRAARARRARRRIASGRHPPGRHLELQTGGGQEVAGVAAGVPVRARRPRTGAPRPRRGRRPRRARWPAGSRRTRRGRRTCRASAAPPRGPCRPGPSRRSRCQLTSTSRHRARSPRLADRLAWRARSRYLRACTSAPTSRLFQAVRVMVSKTTEGRMSSSEESSLAERHGQRTVVGDLAEEPTPAGQLRRGRPRRRRGRGRPARRRRGRRAGARNVPRGRSAGASRAWWAGRRARRRPTPAPRPAGRRSAASAPARAWRARSSTSGPGPMTSRACRALRTGSSADQARLSAGASSWRAACPSRSSASQPRAPVVVR